MSDGTAGEQDIFESDRTMSDGRWQSESLRNNETYHKYYIYIRNNETYHKYYIYIRNNETVNLKITTCTTCTLNTIFRQINAPGMEADRALTLV